MLLYVNNVVFMIFVYVFLVYFVFVQDECELMGVYLMEVEIVDENMWLKIIFF